MIYYNLLPLEELNKLNQTLTQENFPWYYQPTITYNKTSSLVVDPNELDSFGFVHTTWHYETGPMSEIYPLTAKILDAFTKQSGTKVKKLLRIKINLQTPIAGAGANIYNGAHIDEYSPHKVLIYYPSSSDGNTFVFNEIFDKNNNQTHVGNFIPTIKEQITPLENSCYFLENGYTYHSGSNPIKSDKRYVINIAFI